MICPRWVSVETQPIAAADVLGVLVGVCGNEAAHGQSFDLGGPEVMTYRTMERVARLRGKRPILIEVLFLTPWLSSLWLHLVTPASVAVRRGRSWRVFASRPSRRTIESGTSSQCDGRASTTRSGRRSTSAADRRIACRPVTRRARGSRSRASGERGQDPVRAPRRCPRLPPGLVKRLRAVELADQSRRGCIELGGEGSPFSSRSVKLSAATGLQRNACPA